MLSLKSHGGELPESGNLIEHLSGFPRPVVIAYELNGERTELSGRVLVNWATKFANLLEGTGCEALAIDLPVSWMNCGLALGALWVDVNTEFSRVDTEALITDRPEGSQADEIFVTGTDDPTLIDINCEILSQDDRCSRPVGPIIARFNGQPGGFITYGRLTEAVMGQMVATWRKLKPVVIIPEEFSVQQRAEITAQQNLPS